jgi:DNA-binding GntR family transcriptional regulator
MPERSSTSRGNQPALSVIRRAAAPLRQQVVDELRQSIIAGRLVPGARLIERELIKMMGVSRTVIREALRQLESEGLVAIIANKGPVVRELTLGEAKDLYAIRGVLEGLAVRLFIENADVAHVEELERALELTTQAYRSNHPEITLQTKNRFYDVLFEGAASQTLSSMVATLHARIWRWRALGLSHPQRSPVRSKESIDNLRALLAAIKARNADLAEKIIRDESAKAAAEVMRLLPKETAQSQFGVFAAPVSATGPLE